MSPSFRFSNFSSSSLLILALVLALLFEHTAALCYTPDGGISNDISCDATAEASICCKRGYYCTASKLCLAEGHANQTGFAFDGVYVRGTCSDKSWQSPECGGNCVKANPSGGESAQYCGGGRFCCGITNQCCTDGEILNLGEPIIYATAGVYNSATTSTTLATATAAVAPASSTAVMSVAEHEKKMKDKAVAVGVGVGVSLGVLLVAVVAGGLWWMRRRKAGADGRPRRAGGPMIELNGDDTWSEMPAKEIIEVKRVEMP